MLRAYQYRIYPNRGQGKNLWTLLGLGAWLYNSALQERKEAWKDSGKPVSYYEQAIQLPDIRRETDLNMLNAAVCQQVLRRLDKAFNAFFRRLRNGEGPGYPRFKKASRFRSLEFRFGDGASLKDGKLYIQNAGRIKVKWHRDFPDGAVIKDVVVTKKADGWYATFRIEVPDIEFIPNGKPAVGIDLGVVNLSATSDGQIFNSPRWFQVAEDKLADKQRILSNKVKGSKRSRRMAHKIAKLHQHIGNQRKDFWHKFTTQYVNNYGLIALENLNIAGMAQGILPKQISDSGWGMGMAMFDYKALQAGSQIARVNPNGTSQYCSRCGAKVLKDLSVRVHSCPHCGLELDRDVNAARNILRLGMSLRGLTLGEPCPKEAVCFS